MKAIKVKFLTAVLIVVLSFSLIDLCHGEKNRLMTASVDVGRAKAKISAEEMLKLHRKRRDENDKLFSINSPRKNDPENQVIGDLFFIISYLILFYMQHMIKKTSWTFLYFIQSLLILVAWCLRENA